MTYFTIQIEFTQFKWKIIIQYKCKLYDTNGNHEIPISNYKIQIKIYTTQLKKIENCNVCHATFELLAQVS